MPARPPNSPRKTKERVRRDPPHAPIKALRLAAGISLQGLADRLAEQTDCNPGRGTLCAIEQGDRGASPELLRAIETVFNLEPGMLSTSWEPRAPRGKHVA